MKQANIKRKFQSFDIETKKLNVDNLTQLFNF